MTKFYRNTIDITSNEGVDIDAGSLWKLQDDELILIDDDQHVTSPLTEDFKLEPNIREA